MFRLVFPFLLFFFYSCGNSPAEISGKTDSSEINSFVSDSSKKRLLQIVRGGWINEEYISALARYRSPMDAASFGLPEQQMAFDVSELRGDTLNNFYGRVNYHEGQRFEIVFYKKPDGQTGMYINEAGEYVADPMQLNYEIDNTDTVLLLTIAGEENKTLRYRREFHEFVEKDEMVLPAIELHINRNYFAGHWKNGNTVLELDEYGQVINFNGYKRYAVSFIDDYPQSRPDEITFYNDTAGVTYAYTMKDRNLNLYELHQSADGMEISRGKLVYVFKRE